MKTELEIRHEADAQLLSSFREEVEIQLPRSKLIRWEIIHSFEDFKQTEMNVYLEKEKRLHCIRSLGVRDGRVVTLEVDLASYYEKTTPTQFALEVIRALQKIQECL